MKDKLENKILSDIATHMKVVMNERHISFKLMDVDAQSVLAYMNESEGILGTELNEKKKSDIKNILNHIKIIEKLERIKPGDEEWLIELNKKIEKESNSKIILQYMNALQKTIRPKPRKVIYSKELREKIDTKYFGNENDDYIIENADEIIDLVKHFKQMFEEGKDINNHLSGEIFSSNRQDMLFNTWNIKHIHLNKVEAGSKSAMKRNRSEFLLFCVVKEEKVYFIDVRLHPDGNEFSSYSFLEILYNNNLMEEVGFFRDDRYVPGSLNIQITRDEDIYTIYNKCHSNVCFDFKGNLFMSLSGIVSTGDKCENSYLLQQIIKDIRSFPYSGSNYIGFKPTDNNSCRGNLEFKIESDIKKITFNIDKCI